MTHISEYIKELELLYIKISPDFTDHSFSNLKKRAEENKFNLNKHKIERMISDYSAIGLNVDDDTLYNLTRNMKQFLNFQNDIKVAIYEGEKYNRQKWLKYNVYLESFGIDYISGFKNIEDALIWLGLKAEDKKYLKV